MLSSFQPLVIFSLLSHLLKKRDVLNCTQLENLNASKEYEFAGNAYEFVEILDEAYILAQYAMSSKNADELIIIFPGYNIGISRDKTMINKAIKLAEKYKCL